jgi:hypothetical protein
MFDLVANIRSNRGIRLSLSATKTVNTEQISIFRLEDVLLSFVTECGAHVREVGTCLQDASESLWLRLLVLVPYPER